MMTRQQAEDCLNMPKGTVYVRVDSGVRAGAIARVVGKAEWRSLWIEWDGRTKKISMDWDLLTYLPNYNGPTFWSFKTSPKKDVGPEDAIGQQFKVGDLVYYRQGKSNHFGVVTEIKPTGGVYVRRVPISVHSNGRTQNERIISRSDALIIRDNLYDALILRKLKLGIV